MKEKHQYVGTPEPGFQEEMYRAVSAYFCTLPNFETPTFQVDNLNSKHPDLKLISGFYRAIRETAKLIDQTIIQPPQKKST